MNDWSYTDLVFFFLGKGLLFKGKRRGVERFTEVLWVEIKVVDYVFEQKIVT